jgi:Cof subfamily protein (haloacid dehalogenase superfamily)
MTKLVVAIDLDGTLLTEGDLMHPRDREILAACSDVQFVFASGRQRSGIRKSMDANALFKDIPIPFPMVLINGGALYLPGEKLWDSHPFSENLQKDLLQILQPFSDIPFVWQSLDRVYLMHPTPYAVNLMKRIGVTPLQIEELDPGDPFYKVICWSNVTQHLEKSQEILHKFPLEIYVSSGRSVEFNPEGVDKGKGLVRLLEHMDGGKAEIYAVGDNENDLPLLQYARIAFVPSTADPGIQKHAQVIIDPAPRGLLEPLLDYVL